MATPVIERESDAGVSLLEANIRLGEAHSALAGLYGLLKQAEDLSDITGANLAALLSAPLGEVAAAADEVRAAAAPFLRVVPV
jgi:hypothetical protein